MVHNLSYGQSVMRQSIGTIGKTGIADGILIQQTTGQSYQTGSSSGISPGFIQSSRISIQNPKSTSSIELQVYPNPVKEQLFFVDTETEGNVIIQVVNSIGQVVFQAKESSLTNYTINCRNWPAGAYIILVSDEKNVLKSKIIKQ